jgi:hypothetical protein
VILAIASNTQSSRFNGGEAETNRLSERSGINVRNPVLITNATVRKIETLSRNISIGVGCIIGVEPK